MKPARKAIQDKIKKLGRKPRTSAEHHKWQQEQRKKFPLWQYMPNKQAKNRKMLRKKRREAIKVWKRKQKQLKKEKRNEKSI